MKRQRAVFIKGAGERGVKESVATEIFDLMEKFAGYGFNKSHAAAYSYVAYQTAYLKVHHTAAFFAANLCMVMDDGDKMKALIDDARANGVDFRLPDVNVSEWFFSVPTENVIQLGLGAIKGINRALVEAIVYEREANGPFEDILTLLLVSKASIFASLKAWYVQGRLIPQMQIEASFSATLVMHCKVAPLYVKALVKTVFSVERRLKRSSIG